MLYLRRQHELTIQHLSFWCGEVLCEAWHGSAAFIHPASKRRVIIAEASDARLKALSEFPKNEHRDDWLPSIVFDARTTASILVSRARQVEDQEGLTKLPLVVRATRPYTEPFRSSGFGHVLPIIVQLRPAAKTDLCLWQGRK